MGGGGGRTKNVYKERELSKEEKELIRLQGEQIRRDTKRQDDEYNLRQANEAARKASYQSGYGGFYNQLQTSIQRGDISFNQAQQQLTDYEAAGNLNYNQQYRTDLQTAYAGISDTRAETSVNRAYQQLLGRAPTAEELSAGISNMTGGQEGYDYNTLKDDIINSKEYQDEYNKSYLENYYDTTYGEADDDGNRTFDFSDVYMPTFASGIEGSTGITLPSFSNFTGSVEEIKEYQQSIRAARSFAYNAGLTNLQGDIDKELTKMKTQSQERQKRISGEYGLATSAMQNFFQGT